MAKVVRTKGPAYDPFVRALADIDKVTGKVGWFETAHYPDGGPPVALVAAVNEYGWPEHNIPPRLGMRATADAMHAVWTAWAFRESQRVLKGEITAAQAMESLTAKAAGDIRKHIATVTQPPLKVATVKARLRGKDQGNVVSISAAKPLVHTGHLLVTLTNIVEHAK
jgi:hypothetical protein